jgi:hypothetical protein
VLPLLPSSAGGAAAAVAARDTIANVAVNATASNSALRIMSVIVCMSVLLRGFPKFSYFTITLRPPTM